MFTKFQKFETDLILEYVKNPKLKVALVNDMINDIRKIAKDIFIDDIYNDKNEYGYYSFVFNNKYQKNVEEILRKYKHKFDKGDMVFNYVFLPSWEHTDSIILCKCSGIIKSYKLLRIKPTKYVFHVTKKENVESILKYGLKIDKSNPDYWKNEFDDIVYPPSIFATLDGYSTFYRNKKDKVTLRIDTTSLKNKWFVDLYFCNDVNDKYYNSEIMTFEDIPPEYITVEKEH